MYVGQPMINEPGFPTGSCSSPCVIKATFTFSSPLPINYSIPSDAVATQFQPISWHVTDGTTTFSPSASYPPFASPGGEELVFYLRSTDDHGLPTDWEFDACAGTISFQYGCNGPVIDSIPIEDLTDQIGLYAANNVDVPGTWSHSCPITVHLAYGAATGFGDQYIVATFKPGGTLDDYAKACGFDYFDWQQGFTSMPCPSPFQANPHSVAPPNICPGASDSLTATPTHPFSDPPLGGYTAPSYYLGYNPFPFYYYDDTVENPSTSGHLICTVQASQGSCPPFPYVVDSNDTTLTFLDAPADPCLSGGAPDLQAQYCGGSSASKGSVLGFSTSLVGVSYLPVAGSVPCGAPSAFSCTVLKQWKWGSNFNGRAGGAFPQTLAFYPIDQGSGTGGVTITSINGVPLTLVPPAQIATTASGLAYSRVSQTFNGTVTITNVSGSAINVPVNGFFQVLFTSLATGVTLSNSDGTFNASPYITVPTVTSLAPGQSASFAVQFSDPSGTAISFTPVIYSGSLN
jgi:hypothetical protein